MKKSKWKYTENDVWSDETINEIEFDCRASYKEVAEEIARELDDQSAEYPEKREFTLMNVDHGALVKACVWAENIRSYSADIQWPK